MTSTISSLREKLQGPRRPYDTVYGRYVMRRFSIYLTLLFSKLRLTPRAVTMLSIVVGLTGAFLIAADHWMVGILLVNGWYLLDHCDGELARLNNSTSINGLYFDTIANAFIAPLMFFTFGTSFFNQTGELIWIWVGFLGCFAYLMFLIIPFCEAAVRLQWSKSDSACKPDLDRETKLTPAQGGVLKRVFSALHWLSAFPNILPPLTLSVFFNTVFANNASLNILKRTFLFCAALSTLVWMVILTHLILSEKLESKKVA